MKIKLVKQVREKDLPAKVVLVFEAKAYLHRLRVTEHLSFLAKICFKNDFKY